MRPILILLTASLRQQSRSALALLASISTALIYEAVFLLQVVLYYQISPHAFPGLSAIGFLTAYCAGLTTLYLIPDENLNRLQDAIINGDFDRILLQPVSLTIFRHFRAVDLQVAVSLGYGIIGFIIGSLLIHLSTALFIKTVIFIIIVAFIRANIAGAFSGLVFFLRDNPWIGELYYAVTAFAQDKPLEVFPRLIQIFITFFLPVAIVENFIFDLLRGRDSVVFWLLCFIWLLISWQANRLIWTKGLERYESIG